MHVVSRKTAHRAPTVYADRLN